MSQDDGNLPVHENSLSYEWGEEKLEGNNWERKDDISASWKGFLNVPSGGYAFRLEADDWAGLYIDGEEVLSALWTERKEAEFYLEGSVSYQFELRWYGDYGWHGVDL